MTDTRVLSQVQNSINHLHIHETADKQTGCGLYLYGALAWFPICSALSLAAFSALHVFASLLWPSPLKHLPDSMALCRPQGILDGEVRQQVKKVFSGRRPHQGKNAFSSETKHQNAVLTEVERSVWIFSKVDDELGGPEIQRQQAQAEVRHIREIQVASVPPRVRSLEEGEDSMGMPRGKPQRPRCGDCAAD